ncbi:carboxyl transferase domain-containing protein [Sorangium sp. So ce375]
MVGRPGGPRRAVEAVRPQAAVRAVLDDGRLLEIHERFAQNIVVGFARIGGAHRVGRGPAQVPAGCLDIEADTLCPLLGLLHYPARHVGRRARPPPGGSIRNMAGSSLMERSSSMRSPGRRCPRAPAKLTRRLRRHGLQAPPGRLQPRLPNGRDRGHGPGRRGGHRAPREIQRAAVPTDARARFVEDHKAKFANPYKAAELGFIDEVISPRVLRTRLARALSTSRAPGATRAHRRSTGTSHFSRILRQLGGAESRAQRRISQQTA